MTNFKLALYLALFMFLSVLAIGLVGPLMSVITAPGRVLTKTMETGNIISNYEWYFDAKGQYDTRVSQIKTHKALAQNASDTAEISKLNLEISSMQYSCRDLANKYNNNSMKINKTYFKDWRLPETLSTSTCE